MHRALDAAVELSEQHLQVLLMGTGIFPTTDTAGGLEIRDDAGAPTNPVGVEQAYVPAPAYVSTCDLTALPSTCEARIEPKQINAIVSELLSFAECLAPTGPWDCASLKNLCTAFSQWAEVHITEVITISDDPPPILKPNQLWWESDTGILWVYYDDGTSSQWVEIASPTSVVMDGVSIVGDGDANFPHEVGIIDCGEF
jgi:hypothetical protein